MLTSSDRPLLNRVGRVAAFVRDGWLMVGLVVALLLALEGAYRLQGYVRRLVRPATEVVAREEKAGWMPAYLVEQKRAIEAIRWQPFVYYRTEPFKGQYVNVESSGLRRTVQPDVPAGAADVFMFGGSTLFGSFQRDEWTLPSVLAKRFAGCTDPQVRFTNFGVSGRVFTQELVELLLHLRDGASPKVVVFYDGINDVAAAIQNNRPGWPQNESNRSRDFELGRSAFWWETTARSEVRAYAYLGLSGLTRLQFLQRVRRFTIPGPLPTPPGAEVSAAAIVSSYAATVRVIEGLRQEFGFVPIYVWQPTIHSTGKTATATEAAMVAALNADAFGKRLVSLHRDVATLLSAPVKHLPRDRFVNLSSVFDRESGPVFADDVGHTYESANTILSEAIVPHIARALAEQQVAVTCNGKL